MHARQRDARRVRARFNAGLPDGWTIPMPSPLMVTPKGWLSQDRAAPRRVALRVITNSKLSANLPREFNALAAVAAGFAASSARGSGSIPAESWLKHGDAT